jgi:hypothetical protein
MIGTTTTKTKLATSTSIHLNARTSALAIRATGALERNTAEAA